MNIVLFFVSGNKIIIGAFVFLLIVQLTVIPTKTKVIAALNLSGESRDIIERDLPLEEN